MVNSSRKTLPTDVLLALVGGFSVFSYLLSGQGKSVWIMIVNTLNIFSSSFKALSLGAFFQIMVYINIRIYRIHRWFSKWKTLVDKRGILPASASV